MHDGEVEGMTRGRERKGARECVKILLAKKQRPENSGVFRHSRAYVVDESEVRGSELLQHGAIECTKALGRCRGACGELRGYASGGGGRGAHALFPFNGGSQGWTGGRVRRD
jgi:hypothetical protein